MKLAYRHIPYDLNPGKADRLLALFDPFHRACRTVSLHWLHRLEQGEALPAHVRLPDKEKVAGLSARQMNSVGAMCRQAILAWLELLTDQVRKYINGTVPDKDAGQPLTGMERTILHRINKHHLWWAGNPVLYWRTVRDETTGGDRVEPCGERTRGAFPLAVPAHLMELSRRMVRQARKRIGFPDLSHCDTLVLEHEVAKVERPDHTNGDIAWWVRISTMRPGRPVLVGLRGNPYFESEYAATMGMDGGRLCRVIQLHRDPDDHGLSISLVCERPDAEPRKDGRVMGVDWGLADALLATSDGDLMGHAMLDRLKQLDAMLMERQRFLQSRNLPLRKDPRHRALQRRIRGFVTNEVGRILNRIAARDGEDRIRELVFERLDFRHGGMSPAMNRLITRAGRAALKKRQEALTAKHGIAVTKVPSQHTSVECSSCGYANKLNRRDRAHFRCRFCGRTLHADVNASRVVLSRRSWQQPDNTGPLARSNTLHAIEERHRQRWGLPDKWSGPGRPRRSGPSPKPHQANGAGDGSLRNVIK